MAYTKLSDILNSAEKPQHYTIYRRLLQAIREGKIVAVATLDTVTIERKNKPFNVREHALQIDTETALKLLTSKPEKQPKNAVSIAALETGEIDFQEAAQRYKESLQPKAGKQRRRKKAES